MRAWLRSSRPRVAAISLGAVSCLANLHAQPVDKLTYHHDPQRTGWNPHEVRLTPQTVSSPAFGQLWQSPAFDSVGGVAPRLFATPLYVNSVVFSGGPYAGKTFSVVYAVTDLAQVYAVAASTVGDVPAGTILWHKALVTGRLGMPTFATPVIDVKTQRLYVMSADRQSHRIHALDIRDGQEQAGWPVAIDAAAVNAPGINRNGTTQFPPRPLIQRGALTLNPDGTRLYVSFAEGVSSGWIIAVDTVGASVATAFSATARSEEVQGGMWASGGPAVDREGYVHIATGSSVQVHLKKLGLPGIYPDSEHNWGQSILRLRDDPQSGFSLVGTYSPFNWAQAQVTDIDLGSSGLCVIDLDPATTLTPHLLVAGGKQGNAYLLNRAQMPGSLVRRPAMSDDASTDGSLLAPDIQPHLGTRGPLNVFGPYADKNAMNDQARSRTTPAYFLSESGKPYVFVTGSAKTGPKLETSTPPGLARLEIVVSPDQPAYLKIDQLEATQVFQNPGSPVVTSHGGRDAIVWVLDTNVPRTAPLHGPNAPRPVLYAFDALTLKLLWKNEPGELAPTGKYNEPTVVGGMALVGTDRIQAFGLHAPAGSARPAFASPFIVPDAVGPGAAIDPAVLQVGKTIFEQRCVVCHASGQPGIPPINALNKLGTTRIADVLRNGIMRPQATGLSDDEIDAVATHINALVLSAPPAVPAGNINPATPSPAPDINLSGRALYVQHCIACHMPDGSGMPPLQPALRESTIVRGDEAALFRVVLHGPAAQKNEAVGRAHTASHAYDQRLSDEEAADLVTYIRQAFGDGAGVVTREAVTAFRQHDH